MKDKFLSNELVARTHFNVAKGALARMVPMDNQDPAYVDELQKLEASLDTLYRMARK